VNGEGGGEEEGERERERNFTSSPSVAEKVKLHAHNISKHDKLAEHADIEL
jgi:hypothetical protein